MPEQYKPSRWARFCAAMVKHGHGRSADIAVISQHRRPAPADRPGRPIETSQRVSRSIAPPVGGLKPAGLHLR